MAGASGRGTSSARSTPASRTPRPSAWSCGVRSCIENAAGTPTGLPRRHTPPQSATTHPWAHIAQQACRSSQLGLLGRLGRRLKLEIWVPVLPAPPGSGRARWFRHIGLRLRRRLVGTSVAPGRPSGPPALGALGRRLPHGHRARALAAWTAHFPVHPSAFPDLLDFSRPGSSVVQGSGILGWFRVAGPIRTVMWLGQHAPAPLPSHRYVEQGPRGCVRCSMSKPSFRYSAMGRPRSSSRCHDKVRCVRRTTETLGSGSTPVNAARK